MEGTTQIVSIVGQLVGEEYRQLRDVAGQVAELRDELDTMNAILRMLSDADEGAVDHFIRAWMKQVRELAYDAEDCVHLYILRIRCRPRDGFLVWSKRILTTLFPRRRLAREIQELRARAVVISERHARYGVSRKALSRSTSPSTSAPVLRHARSLAANDRDHLVGITEQAKELAAMVKAVINSERDMKPKVFSIVGFGGLGKTTLAMEVCQQLEADFQRQAQVSVSQAFRGTKDMEGLLRRMLRQIVKPKVDNAQGIKEEEPLDDIDNKDEDDLTNMLKELLKDMRYLSDNRILSKFCSQKSLDLILIRYLIVVDDVWTVATWDAIKYRLPDNNQGSRIIVTTRIDTVAAACSGASSVNENCVYRIKPLSLEDSKKLFLSRAFGPKVASCPKGLVVEMHKILKKCGGLPMAIISIAGLLASYELSESKDMWERVHKSIGSHMESHPTLEGMRQIVTLSYNHLPHYLKGCMMYLSIFPEDYVFAKDRLLKRWIAEGLVTEVRGLTLMEVAQAHYNELVSRSMIDRSSDVVTFYDGRLEMCRVHDMMLEVMVNKSLECNFVSLVGGPYKGMAYYRIRRLSIHGGEETEGSPSNRTAACLSKTNGIEGVKMDHVRSLSLFGPDDHRMVLDRLGEFTLLRVLDLEDCMGLENKHLKHVCRMYLLRFLSMKGTSIEKMPPEVGDLENLETLDLRHTLLEDLPETVSKLEKLEHLQISSRRYFYGDSWTARKGLRRMKALRTVNEVVFKCDVDAAKELGELQQLRDLRMAVVSEPPNEEAKKKLAESLSKLYSLRWLNISDRGPDKDVLNFLHNVKPHPPYLQYLRIGSHIDKLPEWVEFLHDLVELSVAWTYFGGDQLFSPICNLPKLKYLDLDAYCYQDKELVAQATQSFPALKDLYLKFENGAVEVLRFEERSMTKLESLRVRFATTDSKSVTGIEHLTSVKEVQLIGKKNNSSLDDTVGQLKTLNEKRPDQQLKVAVKYE
ncbi:disease resistance protein Pik-2-like [Triticum urartu]|nr:disease resistance protein Pik-2-like [Triticum urartu]